MANRFAVILQTAAGAAVKTVPVVTFTLVVPARRILARELRSRNRPIAAVWPWASRRNLTARVGQLFGLSLFRETQAEHDIDWPSGTAPAIHHQSRRLIGVGEVILVKDITGKGTDGRCGSERATAPSTFR